MGQVDDKFICQVCTEIIREPQQCSDCQRMFCTGCMADWARTNSDLPCPYCNKPFRAKSLSSEVEAELQSVRFTCEACSEVYTYSEQ